jgi:hypothetical protein
MVQFQKSNFMREPPKTKVELREILAKAVRNTQPSAAHRPRPALKAGQDRALETDRIFTIPFALLCYG